MNLKEDYEEVCIKIIESIEETFSKLCPLWDKIGLVPSSSRDSTKINLMNSCVEAVDQHLEYIYETELRKQSEYEKRIADLENKIQEICQKLGIGDVNMWIDKEGNDMHTYLNLRQLEKYATTYCSQVVNTYSIQHLEVLSLLEKLRNIYNEMGEEMDPSLDRSEYCVSKEYITILQEQYSRCYNTREQRKIKVPQTVDLLNKYYILLGITPENTVNKIDLFVLSNPDSIPITDLMISQLDERLVALKAVNDERVQQINGFSGEIAELWNLLDISDEDRIQFNNSIPKGLSDNTLQFYQQYIQSLKTQIQMKLRELIPSIREPILSLKEFVDSYSTVLSGYDFSLLSISEDQFTLELYDRHREFLEQLEQEKERLNPIIQNLELKNHLMDCKQELSVLLSDSTRLTGKDSYKKLNRQRELERKVKSIPRLNEKLEEIISAYEAQYGEIIIDGNRMIYELQEEIEDYKRSLIPARVSIFTGK